MANVGHFHILCVSFSPADGRPLAVSARCNACGHVTAGRGAQLTRCPEGVVLICANCLICQTVSEDTLREIHEAQVVRSAEPLRIEPKVPRR